MGFRVLCEFLREHWLVMAAFVFIIVVAVIYVITKD